MGRGARSALASSLALDSLLDGPAADERNVPRWIAESVTPLRQLTDAQLLERYVNLQHDGGNDDYAGAHPASVYTFLASGAPCYKNTSSAAVYRAHIGLTRDAQGQPRFVSFTTWGRNDEKCTRIYEGTSWRDAMKKVNAKLRSKTNKKDPGEAYQPLTGERAELTEDDFWDGWRQRDPLYRV